MSSSPLQLKGLLAQLGVSQGCFARELGISPGTLCDLLNRNKRPAKDWDALQADIRTHLERLGAKPAVIKTALEPQKISAQGSTPEHLNTPNQQEITDMLLQKQTLTAQARQHFGLGRDPFANDINEAADVFVSPDIRYVRETLWQHTRHGGLLALTGESGSGKSTVVADFKDRLQREGRDVVVIEPSVLYMEESDAKGKTLKSAAIVSAIVHTVSPSTPPKRDSEARARQVHKLLTDGRRAGQRHVLVIEEAHCLPIPTLKHLKRFAELKDGLAPLLSIVLVGQPELRQRLAVNNVEVREVAQRCDLIDLPPLDNHLGEYLTFKLARVGAALDKVISNDGIDALRTRLTFARRSGNTQQRQQVSLVYPLAVANALIAALNLAATLGAPVVDAQIVGDI